MRLVTSDLLVSSSDVGLILHEAVGLGARYMKDDAASGTSRTGGSRDDGFHFMEPGGAKDCVVDGRFVHDNELQSFEIPPT
ncbi:unnamed protein product [Microthlaspi erraticum]|uniref:Uncharacterized protein n=1 Tax=Microthlaspi erraticum TaxID=1685480 RepID=A0A6D2KCY3_9BRAS|nr:unnamed protein product [Microthlaspi erraticum]